MPLLFMSPWKCVCRAQNEGYTDRCVSCGDVRPLCLKDPRAKGLGDTIYAVTQSIGLTHCGGCQKRREALNKLVPYK